MLDSAGVTLRFSRIARRALAKAHPGVTLIFHDGFVARGGARAPIVRAVELTADALIEQDYRFITVDELLGAAAYQSPYRQPAKESAGLNSPLIYPGSLHRFLSFSALACPAMRAEPSLGRLRCRTRLSGGRQLATTGCLSARAAVVATRTAPGLSIGHGWTANNRHRHLGETVHRPVVPSRVRAANREVRSRNLDAGCRERTAMPSDFLDTTRQRGPGEHVADPMLGDGMTGPTKLPVCPGTWGRDTAEQTRRQTRQGYQRSGMAG